MKTLEDVREMLEKICYWENEWLVEETAKLLLQGKSVVVDALPYIGNGRWERSEKRGRYKYKMFVPALNENGSLYSTDLFSGTPSRAIEGQYGTYRHTRQKVIAIASSVPAEIDSKRLTFGATFIEALPPNPQP